MVLGWTGLFGKLYVFRLALLGPVWILKLTLVLPDREIDLSVEDLEDLGCSKLKSTFTNPRTYSSQQRSHVEKHLPVVIHEDSNCMVVVNVCAYPTYPNPPLSRSDFNSWCFTSVQFNTAYSGWATLFHTLCVKLETSRKIGLH